MLAIWTRQIAFQPFGFFIKPLAWLLVFPVSYVSAFFQNLTVLGGAERSDMRKSWELARLWPKQSYCGVRSFVSFGSESFSVDLYAVIFSIPFILKILLGIESFLTRSYTWAFSPVLLIAMAAVAYFLIDLLTKAIEVIRCCDGESLATGADLLRRLAASKKERSMHANPLCQRRILALPLPSRANRGEFAYQLHPGMVRLLSVDTADVHYAHGAVSNSTEATEPQNRSASQTLTQPALDRQIERVLQNPEFSWREKAVSTELRHTQNKNRLSIDGWRRSAKCCIPSATGLSRLLKSLLKPFDLKPSHCPIRQHPTRTLSPGC